MKLNSFIINAFLFSFLAAASATAMNIRARPNQDPAPASDYFVKGIGNYSILELFNRARKEFPVSENPKENEDYYDPKTKEGVINILLSLNEEQLFIQLLREYPDFSNVTQLIPTFACRGYLDLLKELHSSSIDLDIKDKEYNTSILHYSITFQDWFWSLPQDELNALYHKKLATILWICDNFPHLLNHEDNNGHTPIITAAISGNDRFLEALIGHPEFDISSLSQKNQQGHTVLHSIVSSIIIETDPSTSYYGEPNQHGIEQRLKNAALLVALAPNLLTITDNEGNAPGYQLEGLMQAGLDSINVDILDALKVAKASFMQNKTNNTENIDDLDAKIKDIFLLANEQKIHEFNKLAQTLEDDEMQTLLLKAVAENEHSTVDLLCQNNPELLYSFSDGQHPLLCAVEHKNIIACDRILQVDSSFLNLTNSQGLTAFQLANRDCFSDFILLVKNKYPEYIPNNNLITIITNPEGQEFLSNVCDKANRS